MIKILNLQIGKHLDRPFIRYALLGHGLTGIEIGTWKGYFAERLFKSGRAKTLYCIDPYELYGDYYFDDLNSAESIAKNKLKPYNVTFIKEYSNKAVDKIKGKVDFIYIDGNHSYNSVKEDIKLYWPKLKEGGIFGGHDFCYQSTKNGEGVIKAVTEFAVKNDLKLFVESPDWWIYKTVRGEK